MRLFKACLFVGMGVGLSLAWVLFISPVVKGWGGSSAIILADRPTNQSFYPELTCPGVISTFLLGEDRGLKQGCMYGATGGMRLVRYIDSAGAYRYGISRPDETEFHALKDVCYYASNCVYSQQTDTLIMETALASSGNGYLVVSQFSKHINFIDEQGGYFHYDFQAPSKAVGTGSSLYRTGAVGIAANGKWAVVELHNYGFIRVNLADSTMRRIVAPGASYGMGTDPAYELAISNSGQQVAVVGYRAGVDVYLVTPECGDILTEQSSVVFDASVTQCPRSFFDRFNLFPGFLSAHIPRFSGDGSKLALSVSTTTSHSRVVLTAPETPLLTSPIQYRAFGDSFTSGEGETSDTFYTVGTNVPTNKCHVSLRSYPYLLGDFWSYNAENMSCSGSTTDNVRELYLKFVADTKQMSGPPLASIGIGGNDVNLMGKLNTCLGLDTCEWATAGNRLSSAREIEALLPKLTELITTLKIHQPETDWFVVGYPLVINASDDARCSSLIAAMLNKTERIYMNESIKLLNTILKSAAHTTHTRYVDIENAFLGERLCDENPISMNEIRIGDDIAPIPSLDTSKIIGAESFHPTPTGHQRMYASIKKQLSSGWQTNVCGECDSSYTPSEYWSEPQQVSTFYRLVSQKFIQAKEILSGMNVRFSFPVGTFKPNATVTFELHSNPIKIGEGIASDDGSLEGVLQLPKGVDGYHTIHAFGKDFYGKDVDIYEIVTILKDDQEISTTILHNQTTPNVKLAAINREDISTEPDLRSVYGEYNLAFSEPLSRDATDLSAKLVTKTSTEQSNARGNVWTIVYGISIVLLGVLGFIMVRKLLKR